MRSKELHPPQKYGEIAYLSHKEPASGFRVYTCVSGGRGEGEGGRRWVVGSGTVVKGAGGEHAWRTLLCGVGGALRGECTARLAASSSRSTSTERRRDAWTPPMTGGDSRVSAAEMGTTHKHTSRLFVCVCACGSVRVCVWTTVCNHLWSTVERACRRLVMRKSNIPPDAAPSS